jgi:hypothetical protein
LTISNDGGSDAEPKEIEFRGLGVVRALDATPPLKGFRFGMGGHSITRYWSKVRKLSKVRRSLTDYVIAGSSALKRLFVLFPYSLILLFAILQFSFSTFVEVGPNIAAISSPCRTLPKEEKELS